VILGGKEKECVSEIGDSKLAIVNRRRLGMFDFDLVQFSIRDRSISLPFDKPHLPAIHAAVPPAIKLSKPSFARHFESLQS
jgi:hypothetical protein